jgi:hypothetical protein
MSKRNQNQPMSPAVGFDLSDMLTKRIEAAEKAQLSLQEATREANAATKGLAEERRKLDDLRASLVDEAGVVVKDLIEGRVSDGLKQFGEFLEKALKDSEAAVFRRFDKLSDILLGKARTDNLPSIMEQVAVMEHAFYLNWENFYNYIISALEVSKGCTAEDCNGVAKYSDMLKHVSQVVGVTAVKEIIPEGEDPEKWDVQGHMHLCQHHHDAAKATGEVMTSVRLETRVCPYPHGVSNRSTVVHTDKELL